MRWLAIGAALFAASCTTYGEMGYAGGVEHRQVGQQVYQIRASGNAFSRLGQIEDFIFLRAAEIGREQGFSHFALLTDESGYRSETITTGGYNYSGTTNCFGSTCNTRGNITGPTTSTVSKPEAEMRVMFFAPQQFAALSAQEQAMTLAVDDVWNEIAPEHLDID
ncbi:CC0125/CC1285 family lipoprotein [Maricaulaceae bacterium MS644]